MNVSACLVTRGDVPLDDIQEALIAGGILDIVVWDNSQREDLAVYGRYAAIQEASGEFIYTQDDDCVVDPDGIRAMTIAASTDWDEPGPARDAVIANMPPEFRHDFYTDHCLVGFGAVFQRDLPEKAFGHFWPWAVADQESVEFFRRTCDIVFTMLTPRVLVDVPYTNLPHATDGSRMYRQREHVGERQRMRDLVRQVCDV